MNASHHWQLPAAPDPSEHSERYVSLLGSQRDFECVLMAAMGLSNVAIERQTGLNKKQIDYRLHKAAEVLESRRLTRKHFRNGTSPLAARVIAAAAGMAAKPLTTTLRMLEG
jgi:hypothetical protein